jgi:hypothetical protein
MEASERECRVGIAVGGRGQTEGILHCSPAHITTIFEHYYLVRERTRIFEQLAVSQP